MPYSVWQAFITDGGESIVSAASVEVLHEADGAPAALFDGPAGASIDNPTTSAIDGLVRFYCAPGKYRINVTKGGITKAFRHVEIGDSDVVKLDAGADKTVAAVPGTKTVAQAFAELDAFDYSAGWIGVLSIPTGYVFTAADALILLGRQDCGWLRIISDQFPTPHTVSGSGPGFNILAAYAALFGFIQSTVQMFTVSVDLTGWASTHGVLAWGANLLAIGSPATSGKAELVACDAFYPGAMLLQTVVQYGLMKGGDLQLSSCTGTYLQVEVDESQFQTAINNCHMVSTVVTLNDGAKFTSEGCPGAQQLMLAPGEVHAQVYLGGRWVLSSTGSATLKGPLTGDHLPIYAQGDLSLTINGDITFAPQTALNSLVRLARAGSQVMLNLEDLVVDDAATPGAYGRILDTGGLYPANVVVKPPAAWISEKYDVRANMRDVNGVLIEDYSEPLQRMVSDSNADRTLSATDFNTYIKMARVAGATVTVGAGLNIPVGHEIPIKRATAGAVSFVADGGVTFDKATLSIAAEGDVVVLKKVGVDAYDLIGPLT